MHFRKIHCQSVIMIISHGGHFGVIVGSLTILFKNNGILRRGHRSFLRSFTTRLPWLLLPLPYPPPHSNHVSATPVGTRVSSYFEIYSLFRARIVAAIPKHFILCSIEDTCSVLISDISLMLWVYTTGF